MQTYCFLAHIGHLWDHKKIFNKLQRTELIQCMFSDPNKIKYRITVGKSQIFGNLKIYF